MCSNAYAAFWAGFVLDKHFVLVNKCEKLKIRVCLFCQHLSFRDSASQCDPCFACRARRQRRRMILGLDSRTGSCSTESLHRRAAHCQCHPEWLKDQFHFTTLKQVVYDFKLEK